MNKYIWIVCIAFTLFISCTGNTNVDGNGDKKVAAKSTSKAKPNQKIKTAPVKLNKPKPISGAIQVDISDSTAMKGEETCVSVKANNFNTIIGLQFSLLFDPSQLKFSKTKSYGLPALTDASFGATKAEQGSLNFLWFDMNVKGITLPNASVLYDLCFEVLADKGTTCEVTIGDKPLKMEVVGPNKSRLKLETNSGKISVK